LVPLRDRRVLLRPRRPQIQMGGLRRTFAGPNRCWPVLPATPIASPSPTIA
jgi:hypothetical protein